MTVTRITDFSVWDLRSRFTEYETAYLWLGLEPDYKKSSWDHPNSVCAVLSAITEAKNRGELTVQIEGKTRHVYVDKWDCERVIVDPWGETIYYTRQVLRCWADQIGQRPLFLFPEDRSVAMPSETLTKLRSEEGKQAASLQHVDKNRQYQELVKAACDLWKKGSSLNHSQMATSLMKDATTLVSRNSLLNKLKSVLIEMGRQDLIRGFSKK